MIDWEQDAHILLSAALSNAFGSAITSGLTLPDDGNYTYMTTLQMAQSLGIVQADIDSLNNTRLKMATFFSTLELAQAAALTPTATITQALVAALLAQPATADYAHNLVVLQPLKVILFSSAGFAQPIVSDQWSFEVLTVTFNRTCQTMGQYPADGCWEIIIRYTGGAIDTLTKKESLNLLYLPRVPRTNADGSSVVDVNTAIAITNDPTKFPCTSSAGGLSPNSLISEDNTACCLRDLADQYYRTPTMFKTFLSLPTYANNAPADYCAATTGFNTSYPSSDIVFNMPILYDGWSNDAVLGGIDGLPHSEIKLLDVVDYDLRKYDIKVSIAEDDLIASAATAFTGTQFVEYTASFFVGMANFDGTGTSTLQSLYSVQNISVSKTSVMTLSSFGANQDPLVVSSSISLQRIKMPQYFSSTPVYFYYLQPSFVMPAGYVASGPAGLVPIAGILIGKGYGLKDPVSWIQACGSSDGSDMFATEGLRAFAAQAQGKLSSFFYFCFLLFAFLCFMRILMYGSLLFIFVDFYGYTYVRLMGGEQERTVPPLQSPCAILQ